MVQKILTTLKTRSKDRSPRLETILMIEKTLYNHRSEKTITQIWKLLPKKVMWTTFISTLKYLEYSGKIIIEKDKTVIWIWNPSAIEKLKKKGLVVK